MKGGAQGVNRFAKWVPGEQGGGLKYPRGFSGTHTVSQGSRGRPRGPRGSRGVLDGVPAGQEEGLQDPRWLRGKLTGSQGVKEEACRVIGGQEGGLQGHRGPRRASTGSITGPSEWGKGGALSY